MKISKLNIISLVLAIFSLSSVNLVQAQSNSNKSNFRYFITNQDLFIVANIRSGSACSLNPGVSVVKLSNFRITSNQNNNIRIAGRVDNILTTRNNRISKTSGQFQSSARMYSPSWLIRNTPYYPEFISEMEDCTTEGGLNRMRSN